jgi:hypothetical protein
MGVLFIVCFVDQRDDKAHWLHVALSLMRLPHLRARAVRVVQILRRALPGGKNLQVAKKKLVLI